jgi:hypothetical protein
MHATVAAVVRLEIRVMGISVFSGRPEVITCAVEVWDVLRAGGNPNSPTMPASSSRDVFPLAPAGRQAVVHARASTRLGLGANPS